jgi:hypothetical protein
MLSSVQREAVAAFRVDYNADCRVLQ